MSLSCEQLTVYVYKYVIICEINMHEICVHTIYWYKL